MFGNHSGQSLSTSNCLMSLCHGKGAYLLPVHLAVYPL